MAEPTIRTRLCVTPYQAKPSTLAHPPLPAYSELLWSTTNDKGCFDMQLCRQPVALFWSEVGPLEQGSKAMGVLSAAGLQLTPH